MVHAEGDCAARSHHDDSYDETFLHCLSTAAKIGEIIQSAKSFADFLHFALPFSVTAQCNTRANAGCCIDPSVFTGNLDKYQVMNLCAELL